MRNTTSLAVHGVAALFGLAWLASPAAAASPVRLPAANLSAAWLRVAAEDQKGEESEKRGRGKNNKSDKLPKAVAEAVKSIFPGGKIVGVEKEDEDGDVAFEVTLRFKSGTLETTLTPKGRVVKVKLKKEDDDKSEKKSKAKKHDDDDDDKSENKGKKNERK